MLTHAGITPSGFAGSKGHPPKGIDVGPEGSATMHGDIASSDTTPLPGPGSQAANVTYQFLLSACPTLLIRSDGNPMALCTSMLDRCPVVYLLNQENGRQEAKLKLNAGSLLGGVYAYLDDRDRLVMVDGQQKLIRIKARKRHSKGTIKWELAIAESFSLADEVEGPCGTSGCDAVVSISPGMREAVWFVTQQGLVGIYNPKARPGDNPVSSLKLAADERVDNSFATTEDGLAAIVTNKALYMLEQNDDNQPQIQWRKGYDPGSARKPGQLSHGSGATPTFFGPQSGTGFVMMTDNADNRISLIVRDTDTGNLICRQPIFTDDANSGTENSAIGFDNSAIVASTYGYPYPALPAGAGPAIPPKADFIGGMVRVDVNPWDAPTCSPCDIVWQNHVRSAAVPKLSTADDLIYTVERRSPGNDAGTTFWDSYHFSAVDFGTGEVEKQSRIGFGLFFDTLQMAGNVGQDCVFWQGTLSGIVRISPPL